MNATEEDKTNRLGALAFNSILEGMVVAGRPGQPITDDDFARFRAIEKLLHLRTEVQSEFEHGPLVAANQQPANPALAKITDLLDKTEATGRVEPRPAISLSRAKTAEVA